MNCIEADTGSCLRQIRPKAVMNRRRVVKTALLTNGAFRFSTECDYSFCLAAHGTTTEMHYSVENTHDITDTDTDTLSKFKQQTCMRMTNV